MAAPYRPGTATPPGEMASCRLVRCAGLRAGAQTRGCSLHRFQFQRADLVVVVVLLTSCDVMPNAGTRRFSNTIVNALRPLV